MEPKILLFDIENSPIVTWAWGIHDDPTHSMKFVKQDWYVMCWAAKWLGERKIMSSSLVDFKHNIEHPDDRRVLRELWKLLDKADIVIAHNGKKFDVRKANARFIKHGMCPPSPYRVIDTLIEARKNFMFTSNRLGDLGIYLNVGEKLETGGFDLWINCMAGKKKAWWEMVRYCKNDVLLLEKVYLTLRPYMKTHPNLSVVRKDAYCPRCGSKSLRKSGFIYTQGVIRQTFRCKDCGGWGTYLISKTNVIKGSRNA